MHNPLFLFFSLSHPLHLSLFNLSFRLILSFPPISYCTYIRTQRTHTHTHMHVHTHINTFRLSFCLTLSSFQCGEPSLWQRTQAAFFERRKHTHPFLLILHAIIKNEMMGLVLQSDLDKWRETLALLSTYGKSEVRYHRLYHSSA